jgi:fused signal recognition particle receptor
MLGKKDKPAERQGFIKRLRARLNRGDSWLTYDLANLAPGGKIDEDALDELESMLVMADVGIDTTTRIIEDLQKSLARKELKDLESLRLGLRRSLVSILSPVEQPLDIDPQHRPFVILMVGVNGAGKTTTIQRNEVPVIAQQSGADPAAVIFDAWEAAKARGIDVLLADTAGRLQNQQGLMDELAKIRRVIARRDESAPHEIMLVLDASQGQNALVQAQKFHDALGLTGITVTKLDGSAKGGILLAIANALQVPVRFIGIGEKAEDMQPFVAEEFVDALLASGGQD